jgi:site-specific DNA-methyltransferase (adenine-specific)
MNNEIIKEIELNNIYNMDCLEGLKRLGDESIDLIITSPPFNLGNNHHTGTKRHKSYEDNLKEEAYQELQIKVLNECFRVLKKTGSMIYHHKNRIKNGKQITPYEWILKTKFIVKQEIVWINRSQNFDKIRFYPFTERVYWLAKDKKTKLINVLNKYDVFDWNEWKPEGTRKNHTRAFPVKFVQDMLSVFPNAKIVLDPYMGSGTVALASKQMGRDFIGFEINEDFIKLSKERLKQEPLFS